jgi:hypothetical protein
VRHLDLLVESDERESCRADVLPGLHNGSQLYPGFRTTVLDAYAPRDYNSNSDIFGLLIHLILYFFFATILVQVVRSESESGRRLYIPESEALSTLPELSQTSF